MQFVRGEGERDFKLGKLRNSATDFRIDNCENDIRKCQNNDQRGNKSVRNIPAIVK